MFFYQQLEKFSDRTALITDSNEKISYLELLEIADKIAKPVQKRSLVFQLCRNSVESVAGYAAFLRAEIVPALLPDGIDAKLLQSLMENYRPAFCWVPRKRADEFSGSIIYEFRDYVLLRTDVQVDYTLSDELALLLTTSGSTGSPKFVRQSYKNLQSNTASIVEYLGIRGDNRAITTMPMNYTYGLSIINSHFWAGACVILTGATLMEKAFWNLLKEQKATTFGGVPYIYEMLKKLHFSKMQLPELRYLTQAGGRLPPELASEFAEICSERGMKFIIMYGQTEATARMSWLPWEDLPAKPGSIGIAIPGGRFWLEGVSGEPLEEAEEVGELIYSGDNVTLGYAADRHDLCKPDENHGVLRTGDMAKRDKDGYYYVVGRKKRFLKLFGNRVNLDEVESLLKKEGIECACAGVDDCLKVYLTDAGQKSAAEQFLVHHTGISRGGFKILVIDQIPRSDSGKVLYSKLE